MNVALLIEGNLISTEKSRNSAYSNIAFAFCHNSKKLNINPIFILTDEHLYSTSFSRLWKQPCYRVPMYRPQTRRHAHMSSGEIGSIIDREKIDVAHIQFGGIDHWGFQSLHKRINIPYAITFHSFLPHHLKQIEPGYLKPLSYLVKNTSEITAVSHSCKEEIIKAFPTSAKKIQVVPNGVEIQSSLSLPGKRAGQYLLFVGEIYTLKGIDILLFALYDLIHNGFPKIELIMCGRDLTGDGFTRLARKLALSRHIRLLGIQPHSYVKELMSNCLFLVSASREESFGMAILEAMSVGKAVVAPDTGGITDYITHGKNGLLFERANPNSLACAITRLLKNPSLRKKLEKKAFLTARSFHWPKIIQQYANIYSNALTAS